MSFNKFKFKDYINVGLESIGFSNPTEIQELIIPKALKYDNIIGKSATGTGKTHSFLLPILQHLTNEANVQAVIISPTRELASQIYNDLNDIIKFKNDIDARLYVGGSNRDVEVKRLEKTQPQIVVGTIGKIKDLAVDTNVLKIHSAKTVVIDEADMVFEANEIEEIDKIFSTFNNNVQMLTFSATIPKELIKFLNKYLSKCELVDITNKEISKESIEHIFIPTKNKNKNELLLKLLNTFNPYLVIIFANTRTKVDEVAEFLSENGIKLLKLTGDLESRERRQVLKRIKDGQVQFVVASDIASRGIDIEGVSHIINYELPNDLEFYIHRTGRTARYDNDGKAISFYDFEDDVYIDKLKAKGLDCKYRVLKGDQFVSTSERNYQTKSQSTIELEENIHKKHPLPKKVKPGYKKKRNEIINKEIRQEKKARISEMYRKRKKKQ